ncbi:MAG: 50S ribosomal protein L16 [Acholeplasmatales bacterium]|nr:50S ribosomal protein L16 [Acholeplasmatales bacterium]
MLMIPKRTKFRRPHRVYYDGKAKAGTELAFGEYGLVALEGTWLTNHQIEAARVAITRYFARGGKVWIKVFPHISKTKKPLAVRMGSGKGSPESWVAVVKAQTIIFEATGVSEEVAREAFRLAGHKLPIKTKFIKKGDAE